MFAASDISSVIALAEPENGRDQTQADESTRKRQIDADKTLTRKLLITVGDS
jgi:hypothetical protein